MSESCVVLGALKSSLQAKGFFPVEIRGPGPTHCSQPCAYIIGNVESCEFNGVWHMRSHPSNTVITR